MADRLWTNQRVDLIILQESVSGFSGLFGYSPNIGLGNLIFSLAAVAGVDPYGNVYPAGLSITGASSVITGNDYVINSAGEFFYSATPAAGNLVASVANTTGTDSFGNHYLAGHVSYNNGAGLAVSVWTDALTIFSGSLSVGWTAQGSYTGDTLGDLTINPAGSGAAIFTGPASFTGGTVEVSAQLLELVSGAVETITAALSGGRLLTVSNTTAAPSNPSLQLIAAAAADNVLGIEVSGDTDNRLKVDSNGKMQWGPGGVTAQDTDLYRGGVGVLQTDSTLAITNQAAPAALAGAAQFYATAGQPAYENPQGLELNLSGGTLAAVNVNTVTQAAFNSLAFGTIPASDAEIGAVYKYTAFGYGTWGSTQQQLTLAARFGSTASTVAVSAAIAATALAASAAFRWDVEVIAVCVTTGSTGTWQVEMKGCVTQTANPILPGTAADNSIPFSTSSGTLTYTLSTIVAENLGVSAEWASTTGAPTISKAAGWLERIA